MGHLFHLLGHFWSVTALAASNNPVALYESRGIGDLEQTSSAIYFLDRSKGQVQRLDKKSGNTTTVVSDLDKTIFWTTPSFLIKGPYLFFSDYLGNVNRTDLTGLSPLLNYKICKGQANPGAMDVDLRRGRIYGGCFEYSSGNDQGVRTTRLDGSGAFTLFNTKTRPSNLAIATSSLSSDYLYVANYDYSAVPAPAPGLIYKVSKNTGAAKQIGIGAPAAMKFDGENLYWADVREDALIKMPLFGGKKTILARKIIPSPTGGSVSGDLTPRFELDGDYIYYISNQELALNRVHIKTGKTTTLVSGDEYIHGNWGSRFIVDRTHIYWVQPHINRRDKGAIWRLRK